MKRHLLFIYWLVLLVSTLAIGAVAFQLLDHERQHIQANATYSVTAKGQTLAEDLNRLVDEAKSGLIEALSSFPDTGLLEPNLMAWKNSNVYVSSVFLYTPGRQLIFSRQPGANRDNLEPLLRVGNNWIWDKNALPSISQTRLAAGAAGVPLSSFPSGNSTGSKYDREEIRQEIKNGSASLAIARTFVANTTIAYVTEINGTVSVSQKDVSATILSRETFTADNNLVSPDNPAAAANSQGVLPTQPPQLGSNAMEIPIVTISSQNGGPEQRWTNVGPPDNPRWIGWYRPTPGAPVRGVELNMAALIDRMPAFFPDSLDTGEGFVLRDPAGKIAISRFAKNTADAAGRQDSQMDSSIAEPAAKPLKTLTIDEMPGWTLGVYLNPAANFSSSFVAVSSLMVTILIASLLVGGTLLLRQARREALDASRKTNFVSNVSHELKTPLTTIRMYAELLGDNRVRDQAKQRNYLDTIIAESQRLTRLVNNVLDFGRLEQGRKQYNTGDEDLAPLVSRVLDTQRPRLEEAGFKLETILPAADPVRIHADRDAVEQVLLNLVDNAMKYAASGGWLGVSVARNGTQAILTISDHGPGVPAEHLDRIFDMFHRVDDSLTGEQSGSGLGLSIARRLLRDQGGDLRCEPISPTGVKFIATLPLAE